MTHSKARFLIGNLKTLCPAFIITCHYLPDLFISWDPRRSRFSKKISPGVLTIFVWHCIKYHFYKNIFSMDLLTPDLIIWLYKHYKFPETGCTKKLQSITEQLLRFTAVRISSLLLLDLLLIGTSSSCFITPQNRIRKLLEGNILPFKFI